MPSELLRRDGVPGLEELRLQAVEWRADAGLQLGRDGELVTELESLAGRFPLRERFHGQLMLALVRCGRQAEALQAYQRARGVLVEELGTEPGAELRDLHQQILVGDPALAVPAPAALAGNRPAAVVPRELPAPVAHFAGRADELAALTGLLDRSAGQEPSAVVISAIGGTAGVGKTALAVQWAHHVSDRFPDGQLYVNLRGYDPGQPVTAADALAGFLCALGVSGQDIPPEEDGRAAKYRSLLAGKRVLVVLDNAGSVEQVRPLLPGSAACAVVVTSRDALAGLVARDGAARLDLDVLPLEDAVGLLRVLIGRRVDDDQGAAETLAGQCCRLPLALRVAAELAAARPDAPLADLAGELADQQGRLDLLQAGGDPRTAVRAVFSWSYRHLDASDERAFRLLGLHPGPDFDPYAAAALTGISLRQARQVLDALTRAHLVQPTAQDRYGMHDLLRAYARELAVIPEAGKEQRAALTRLFDHYLHTAGQATDTLFPSDHRGRHRIPSSATPIPLVIESAGAQAWLDAQRTSLVATAAYAAVHGWPDYVTALAATLGRHLEISGHYPEALIIHGQARQAAHRSADRGAEATALTNLAVIQLQQGRHEQATADLRRALTLFRETGDRSGQGRALGNLGIIDHKQGRLEQAAAHHQQALALFRATRDRAGQARANSNLGRINRFQGRYEQAAVYFQRALALHRETNDRVGQARALAGLGLVDQRQGRLEQAAGRLQQALALSHEVGDPDGEAHTLSDLGVVYQLQARWQQAIDHHEQALAMCREIGDRSGEAIALNGLGESLLATGQPGDACARHAAALGLARQLGDTYQQARAHQGLAGTYQATRRSGQANYHWQQALALFTELGVPEADQVRAQLAAADDDGDRVQEAGQ